jgi:hypothetical protein
MNRLSRRVARGPAGTQVTGWLAISDRYRRGFVQTVLMSSSNIGSGRRPACESNLRPAEGATATA